MKISEIHENESNPRYIRDEQFEKLVKSVKDFPKMLSLRPIIVDKSGTIIAGNMRYKALLSLGYKDIPDNWVKVADELTEDQVKEFIIKDNLPFGEWDFDMLANEWDNDLLEEWGMTLHFGEEEEEEREKSGESTQQKLEFTFSNAQADLMRSAIRKSAETEEFRFADFDNDDADGNALFLIVKNWMENK